METRLLIGGEPAAGNGPSLAVEDPAREEILVYTRDAADNDAGPFGGFKRSGLGRYG
jgi:hypothetical protein